MTKVKLCFVLALIGLAACSAAPDDHSLTWAQPATPAQGSPVLVAMADYDPSQALLWDVVQGVDQFKKMNDNDPCVAGTDIGALIAGRFVVAPGMEITCRVRLAMTAKAPNSHVTLGLAADPTKLEKERRLDLTGTFNGITGGFNFKPYPTISPVLDPAIRIPLERDMAATQAPQDHWFLLRLQVGDGWLRGWVDDRLQFHRVDKTLTGLKPVLLLGPNTRVTRLRIDSMAKYDSRYEVIPLDGYTNAQSFGAGVDDFVDGFAHDGRTMQVGGLPVRFPANLHHIDLSPSLCRQGNWDGYHAANSPRFAGTSMRDPARIQLAIPNGSYRAMHVVAAFDEQPGRIPIMSAMFYRPGASFPMVFEAQIPGLRATQSANATPLPVKLNNGKAANLWLVKIPLDPAMLASFSDMSVVELELTKQVFQHRSYPDPYMYGWHQGGLPSGVRIFAVTLERPTVDMVVEPSQFGHVWKAGQTPNYRVKLNNLSTQPRNVTAKIETVSYDQTEKPAPQSKDASLKPGQEAALAFDLPVKRNGIHRVTVTLTDGNETWTEVRNLCLLAKDTRAEKWTQGQGPLFGYWSYWGGHYTPSADENIRVMAWAGARGVLNKPKLSPEVERDYWVKHNMVVSANAWPVQVQWNLGVDNPDPALVAAYQKKIIEDITTAQGENPELVTFFPEPHISPEATVASPREYWGEPPRQMTAHERAAFKAYWNTSKVAAEAVRQKWPNTKILIPWGDPLFIVPFLREGFPKNLIDGCGLDMIGFERLPEEQIHQASTHRLYILKNEFRKVGIEKPLLHYVEGAFAPTEPGALTWAEQAERLHRWNLISMAYGIDRYYSSWTSYDAGSYYGTEHYAGCGINRRIPYADPKPAYATYSTMTRMLDRSKFTRWLPTGSLTTYCLEFENAERGMTYAFWTVRGKRPVTLSLEKDAQVTVNDAMDNATTVASKDKTATITISTTPIYVYGAGKLQAVAVGEPDHSDAIAWSRGRNQETWSTGVLARRAQPEIQHEVTLASLGDSRWKTTDEKDEIYQTNNYDTMRYHGKMSARPVAAEGHGAALAVKLEAQETERKLMPFYTVIKPEKPVAIPGKASALGMWVKAHSDWGRVIYSLRDAKGERWISIGQKDEWNCDDVHGWSSFNFDGWRYLRFELPSHLPYDSYREHGTTWWRFAGGDEIVDLPLTVDKVIVERRTHAMYVNDIQPTNSQQHDVLLGELVAEYATSEHATPAMVERSRVRMTLPSTEAEMPNPIMAAGSAAHPGTTLRGVKDPDWGYDGTRCHVNFDAVPGAKQYQVWVAAHPDGRGAQAMARMTASGQMLEGLRSQTTFYLWVTYTGADDKPSKPSNRIEIKLVDAFGMK